MENRKSTEAVRGKGVGVLRALLPYYCRNAQNKVIVVFSFVLIDAKERLCINQFEKLVHRGLFKSLILCSKTSINGPVGAVRD